MYGLRWALVCWCRGVVVRGGGDVFVHGRAPYELSQTSAHGDQVGCAIKADSVVKGENFCHSNMIAHALALTQP